MATETTAQEMYELQKYFGTYEVNAILGDFNSYKQLREVHTYKQIYEEVYSLIYPNVW
jgi:hypothetical protein